MPGGRSRPRAFNRGKTEGCGTLTRIATVEALRTSPLAIPRDSTISACIIITERSARLEARGEGWPLHHRA